MVYLIWRFLAIISGLSQLNGLGSAGVQISNKSSNSSHGSENTQDLSSFFKSVFHSSITSTLFSYSPITHTKTIISPEAPLIDGDYHYFWGEHYVHNEKRPQKCEFQIPDDDLELKNVIFSNGTRPTYLTFGCASSDKCCGMECCSKPTRLVVILVVLGFLYGIVMYWLDRKGYIKSTREHRMRRIQLLAERLKKKTQSAKITTTRDKSIPKPPGLAALQLAIPAPSGYNHYLQSYGKSSVAAGNVYTSQKF